MFCRAQIWTVKRKKLQRLPLLPIDFIVFRENFVSKRNTKLQVACSYCNYNG